MAFAFTGEWRVQRIVFGAGYALRVADDHYATRSHVYSSKQVSNLWSSGVLVVVTQMALGRFAPPLVFANNFEVGYIERLDDE